MNMILGQGKPRTYKGYKNFAILPQVGKSYKKSYFILIIIIRLDVQELEV